MDFQRYTAGPKPEAAGPGCELREIEKLTLPTSGCPMSSTENELVAGLVGDAEGSNGIIRAFNTLG